MHVSQATQQVVKNNGTRRQQEVTSTKGRCNTQKTARSGECYFSTRCRTFCGFEHTSASARLHINAKVYRLTQVQEYLLHQPRCSTSDTNYNTKDSTHTLSQSVPIYIGTVPQALHEGSQVSERLATPGLVCYHAVFTRQNSRIRDGLFPSTNQAKNKRTTRAKAGHGNTGNSSTQM